MIDLYGTPYSEKLHVVERYRLIDYEDAKEGLERDAKENRRAGAGIDRSYRGKHLQLLFTVEDRSVFTTPWTRDHNLWPRLRRMAGNGLRREHPRILQQQGLGRAKGGQAGFLSGPNDATGK